jgi:hypothetical protein
MNETDKNTIDHIEELTINNNKVYGISTKPNVFPSVENLTMDGTAIKTIARSNPFVLVLENGKIVEKKSLEDFLKH